MLNFKIIKSKYKVIKPLGRGSFGKADKVLNMDDNKYYVIKTIQIPSTTSNREQIEKYKTQRF